MPNVLNVCNKNTYIFKQSFPGVTAYTVKTGEVFSQVMKHSTLANFADLYSFGYKVHQEYFVTNVKNNLMI